MMIHWSDADQCWIATIRAYPYVSGLGATPEAAWKELKIVLAAVAELEAEEGRSSAEAPV